MTKKRNKYMPILEMDELQEIFEYPNRRSMNRSIRLGRFPVPLFMLQGRRVAHKDAVDLFFEEKKKQAIAHMQATRPWDMPDV
jgi:hypothetical protein